MRLRGQPRHDLAREVPGDRLLPAGEPGDEALGVIAGAQRERGEPQPCRPPLRSRRPGPRSAQGESQTGGVLEDRGVLAAKRRSWAFHAVRAARPAHPRRQPKTTTASSFPNPGRRDDDHELLGPGLVERVERMLARDERRRQFRHRDLALRDRIRRHPATSIISCPRPGPRLGPLRPVAGPAGDAGDLLRRRRVAPGQWALDRSTASAEAEPDGTAARGPAADRRGPT
jgi:hypothetical protein